MPFAEDDYNNLINNERNSFFKEELQVKYNTFKKKDPFPKTVDALLNSVDILKYIVATGMISPFDIKKLKGVTYICHFSGSYFYWTKEGRQQGDLADEDEELVLRSNSITYLETSETFRVPDYIVIRYNLEVKHVYKGLLLGTGPIVDPGFVGKLYIPLHNLTSNEYIIKKGASIITLEFTKVGRNMSKWPQSLSILDLEYDFDFSGICHQNTEITPDRPFNEYLVRALISEPLFRKKDDSLVVSSSIPDAIVEAREAAQKAEKDAENARMSADKAKSWMQTVGIAAVMGTIIAVASLLCAVMGIVNDAGGRVDSLIEANNNISNENKQLHDDNNDLKEQVFQLEQYMDELSKKIDNNNKSSDGQKITDGNQE